MPNFSMRKSIYGNYIAVRVRDDNGNSDTVDQLYSADEIRRVYARLCREMTPIQTPVELEAQIARLTAPAPDWPVLMDTPAFHAYCEAMVRADEAEMRAEHED